MKTLAQEHYDISLLYVEDERVTREQVSRILQRFVTELHVAENGQEGLQLYREKRPDIILTDIMMPVMDGLAMCRQIRNIDRDSQLIMLTAHSDTEYLLECISLGVNQYVQKPVDFVQLASAIETCSSYILLKRKILRQEARIQMLSQAVEQAPAPVIITSLSGSIEYVNAMFTRLTGYGPDEVLGRNPRLLKSGITPVETYEELWRTITGGDEWKGELANKHKNGSIYWETVKISPLRGTDGVITGFLKVSQDITDRKLYEEKLHYLGTHDPLTGLYNRAYFDAELQRLGAGRDFPVSVVIADIDGLKEVNDHQGHDAGDRMIKGAATVLLSAFRASDAVARIGGDEFAVLLPRTDHEAVTAVIQRLRNGESDPNLGIFARHLSLGAATAKESTELHNVIKSADRLMYADKTKRRRFRKGVPLIPEQ
ncbi:sensor domain-containing diguanylate cyclase [Trichlorobacter ammonificans]|uniref:Response regulator receiver modulated diguanylate cyclase with PAS/PAC sensor n=1 Tax=Trichlorobacter ammonificans TaxID=2916410 RepID=A0ABM9D4Q2_9BACT|nr:diguanylate cyclase [Trichlorobacter ammonificans]CAH2029833.1 Response regulator receiver modulated diguanylate cyclase with PAS/PAC sensor [Trichlorobacter ammonificans]